MGNGKKILTAVLVIFDIIFYIWFIGFITTPQEVSRQVLELEVLPEKKTPIGKEPQEYWMFYRVQYEDGTCEYYWEEISRKEYAKIRSEQK